MARENLDRLLRSASQLQARATLQASPPVMPDTRRVSWYESGLFWGCFSFAAALVLAVIAAMLKDLRWLLILAWPFAGVSCWVVCRELPKGLARWASFMVLFVAVGLGLLMLDRNLPIYMPASQVVTIPQVVTAPLQHLYIPNEEKERTFETALDGHKGHRQTVRVGCTEWSQESCVAAGKFLIIFSRAGWKIDAKKVFRMQQQIPTDGVALVSNDPNVLRKGKDLPPHLGVWHKASTSEQTFLWAFKGLGIPVSSSSDPSLPNDTLGIYFGPEPQR
jgi:hypothetical protein